MDSGVAVDNSVAGIVAHPRRSHMVTILVGLVDTQHDTSPLCLPEFLGDNLEPALDGPGVEGVLSPDESRTSYTQSVHFPGERHSALRVRCRLGSNEASCVRSVRGFSAGPALAQVIDPIDGLPYRKGNPAGSRPPDPDAGLKLNADIEQLVPALSVFRQAQHGHYAVTGLVEAKGGDMVGQDNVSRSHMWVLHEKTPNEITLMAKTYFLNRIRNQQESSVLDPTSCKNDRS